MLHNGAKWYNFSPPRWSFIAPPLTAVDAKADNEGSLLLPQRFKDYLKDVYFANFDLTKENVPLSRHSVGHGVAKASDVNLKSAVLGILIVHQLFYFLLVE